MLKDAGYHTALIGKWHLGFRPHFGPEKSGYMHHFGPMSGGVSYYSHNARGESSDLELDGEPYDEPGYLTDLFPTAPLTTCTNAPRKTSRSS